MQLDFVDEKKWSILLVQFDAVNTKNSAVREQIIEDAFHSFKQYVDLRDKVISEKL